MNKKIILSFLLVLLVAISVSAVSAETIDDVASDEIIADDIVANEAVGEDIITAPADTNVLAEDDPTPTDTPDATEIQGLKQLLEQNLKELNS